MQNNTNKIIKKLNHKGELESSTILGILICVFILMVIPLVMWILPIYNVWSSEKGGEANLQRATQERKILIEQAEAEKEAALLQAEAIETLGELAKKYPEYREQEFIRAFSEAIQSGVIDQIIYVPTENNIPIIKNIGE